MVRKISEPTRRAGLLMPSSSTCLEQDFLAQAPAGWSFHSARMYLEDISLHALARLIDEFCLPAARDLACIEPDVVLFASSSAAVLRGNEYEEQLKNRLEKVVHTRVVMPMQAARKMLKKQHFTRLAVITPYVGEINQQIRAALEHDDFKVLRIEGFSLTRCIDSGRLPIDQVNNVAKLIVKSSPPDALFICGSNLPVLSHLKELQAAVNCPVICNNQAILEEMFNP